MASICIISLNYAPEPIGIGPYSHGWARHLAERGHDVRVVCGIPYYPEWQQSEGYPNLFAETVEQGVTVARVPHYIPRHPSAAKRMAHYATFAANAARAIGRWKGGFRPAAVIGIAPALLAAPVALRFASRSGAMSWLHIQDFEVGAAAATGLLPGWLQAPAARFEGAVLGRFNALSTISPRMVAMAQQKAGPNVPVWELRNWAEEEVGQAGVSGDAIRSELALPEGPIALYSGNLARKQGVGRIVEAAQALAGKSGLQFVVCGAGPETNLIREASGSIANLHHRPLQPRARLPELLAMADIHLLPQIAQAADLVLPSKLANMLASGRPVVALANPETSLAKEVEGCGIVVPTEDRAAFAAVLAELAQNPERRGDLGLAARCRALEVWAKPALLARFADVLERAIEERAG